MSWFFVQSVGHTLWALWVHSCIVAWVSFTIFSHKKNSIFLRLRLLSMEPKKRKRPTEEALSGDVVFANGKATCRQVKFTNFRPLAPPNFFPQNMFFAQALRNDLRSIGWELFRQCVRASPNGKGCFTCSILFKLQQSTKARCRRSPSLEGKADRE